VGALEPNTPAFPRARLRPIRSKLLLSSRRSHRLQATVRSVVSGLPIRSSWRSDVRRAQQDWS